LTWQTLPVVPEKRIDMIEPMLRRFCESKHRRLIVIAGTFVVGLLLVLPLVDVYCAGLNEKEALLAELESAKRVAAALPQVETRVAEKLAQLEAFQQRTVDEQSLPTLREKLMDLAKEAGCSIRRLNVGAATSRPWTPNDNPIGPHNEPVKTESNASFLLEWRPVSISLSGTSANLRNLVNRVTGAGMLMHTKTLEMYPSSATRQTLTLDMEIWYFTLARRG
jgi:hypothetical protein